MNRNFRMFDREWSIQYFEQRGWRGRWLAVMNWFRLLFERRVQWHALQILDNNGFDLDTVQRDWQTSKKSVRVFTESSGYTAAGFTQSPPQETLDAVEQTNEVLARLVAHPRAKRYSAGRKKFSVYELKTDELHTGELIDGKTDDRTNSGEDSEVPRKTSTA